METLTPAISGWDRAVTLYHEHRTGAEITWIVFAYGFWTSTIWNTATRTGPSRARKIPHSILTLHTVSSVMEFLLYYIFLARTGDIPQLSTLNFALSIVQAMTGMWLAATIHRWPRGHLQSVRCAFQCMAIQRILASAIAYRTGSAFWHKASIKLLNNFIWARFLIYTVPKYITGFESFHSRINVGVIGCHFLGLWEGDYPNGIGIYMGLSVLLLALDRWGQGKNK